MHNTLFLPFVGLLPLSPQRLARSLSSQALFDEQAADNWRRHAALLGMHLLEDDVRHYVQGYQGQKGTLGGRGPESLSPSHFHF